MRMRSRRATTLDPRTTDCCSVLPRTSANVVQCPPSAEAWIEKSDAGSFQSITTVDTRASCAKVNDRPTGPATLSAGGLCQNVSVLPSVSFSTPCALSPVAVADTDDDDA